MIKRFDCWVKFHMERYSRINSTKNYGKKSLEKVMEFLYNFSRMVDHDSYDTNSKICCISPYGIDAKKLKLVKQYAVTLGVEIVTYDDLSLYGHGAWDIFVFYTGDFNSSGKLDTSSEYVEYYIKKYIQNRVKSGSHVDRIWGNSIGYNDIVLPVPVDLDVLEKKQLVDDSATLTK